MSRLILKVIPAVIFWGIFIFVVLQIPYPESLTQANIVQILSFFIPLFLGSTVAFNYFFKNIILSATVTLGLIFLLVIEALDSLNFVTATVTIVAIALVFSYFKKIKKRSLTKSPKIPKLTQLRKQ